MLDKKTGKVSYKSFGNLSKYSELINFVSTRESGNMAFVNGKRKKVLQNLEYFLTSLEINMSKCYFAGQVHGNKVTVVKRDIKLSDEIEGINLIPNSDALVTDIIGICLIIKTADCVPIIIYDPIHKVLSVVHAGWRGTLGEIAKETVTCMANSFSTNPKDLVVGIGPSIGPDDYLIGEDVFGKFNEQDLYKKYLKEISDDRWKLDLWRINQLQLMHTGVEEKNIEISGISTFTSNLFYSYRKKETLGHFITGAMLK